VVKGFNEIAITDSCKLDGDLDKHFEYMQSLPYEINGVRILKGIESYIYPNGILSTNFNTLHKMDWVIACVDRNIKYANDMNYVRIVHNILADSKFRVRVLGHLMRWYGIFDFEEMVRMCKYNDVLIEINTGYLVSPSSFENMKEMLECIQKHQAKIVVSSTAHHAADMGEFSFLFPILSEVQFDTSLIYNIET
jgi:putative hydrolase